MVGRSQAIRAGCAQAPYCRHGGSGCARRCCRRDRRRARHQRPRPWQCHRSRRSSRNIELEAAIARIDADIVALKAGVEQNARLGVTQFNKTSDRLDKVEKAQVEPSTKLAKLSDEISKLRATQAAAGVAVAAAPVAAAAPVQSAAAAPATTVVAKDVTGSVAPVAATSPALPGTAAKPEVARLPTVEGWVLRDVGYGGALIQSRRGVFEIYAGDSIPGLGRVDAILRGAAS